MNQQAVNSQSAPTFHRVLIEFSSGLDAIVPMKSRCHFDGNCRKGRSWSGESPKNIGQSGE
nr:hypothetical protein [uncultured Sphingobacterium sp.]